jgi:hypothetical protein
LTSSVMSRSMVTRLDFRRRALLHADIDVLVDVAPAASAGPPSASVTMSRSSRPGRGAKLVQQAAAAAPQAARQRRQGGRSAPARAPPGRG